jgi:N-sulfoglucosamine sulfohydrolase
VLANCDDSATKALLVENGWGEQDVPEEQLFDLVFDPNEASNLATSPKHAETLASLRERLEEWMRSTDDPLLEGPVAMPAGAWANDPSQGSPNDPSRRRSPTEATA